MGDTKVTYRVEVQLVKSTTYNGEEIDIDIPQEETVTPEIEDEKAAYRAYNDARRRAEGGVLARDVSIKETINAIRMHINGPSRMFEKALLDEFDILHPTLQQAFVRHVVRPVLEKLVEQAPYADARNQHSTRFAQKAIEATKEIHLPTV